MSLQRSEHDLLRANGAYYPNLNSVHIRQIGTSMYDTALLHEILVHRVPYYLFNDSNPNHSDEWGQFEQEMTAEVHTKVPRCDEKYKKENQNIFIKIFNKFFR